MTERTKPYPLYLQYDETRSGGEPLSNDEWCSYSDEEVTFSPVRLKLTETESMYQETIDVYDLKPRVEDTLYLIVVRYTTGSSFGESKGNWKIIGVVQKENEAFMARNCISELNYIGNPRGTPKLVSFYTNGETIYPSWAGYFETLEDVEIHKMVVAS